MCFSNKIVIHLYDCPGASPTVLLCLGNPGHQFVKSPATGSCAVLTFAELLTWFGYISTHYLFLQWSCKQHSMWVSVSRAISLNKVVHFASAVRTKGKRLMAQHNWLQGASCFLKEKKTPLLFFMQCNNAMLYNL